VCAYEAKAENPLFLELHTRFQKNMKLQWESFAGSVNRAVYATMEHAHCGPFPQFHYSQNHRQYLDLGQNYSTEESHCQLQINSAESLIIEIV
jgi:hypothetical protein